MMETHTRSPFLVKMEHFWDTSSTQQPNFCDWLTRFDNWIALQNALMSDAQNPLSLDVRCRSLVQHLGAEAHRQLAAKFEEETLTTLHADYKLLRTVLIAIFAQQPSHCLPDDLPSPQQEETCNASAAKSEFSVECSRLGTISLASAELDKSRATIGVQTEQYSSISLVSCSAQTESVSCLVSSSCQTHIHSVSRHTNMHTHSVSSCTATQTDLHEAVLAMEPHEELRHGPLPAHSGAHPPPTVSMKPTTNSCMQTNAVSEMVSCGAQTVTEPHSAMLRNNSVQCTPQAAHQLTTKHQRKCDTRSGECDMVMSNSHAHNSPPLAPNMLCFGCASSVCQYKSPECPAVTNTCTFCRHIGHFSRCCRKRQKAMELAKRNNMQVNRKRF